MDTKLIYEVLSHKMGSRNGLRHHNVEISCIYQSSSVVSFCLPPPAVRIND